MRNMSFTFPLNGVTQIVMIRKVPKEKKVSVSIDDVQLIYALDAPGGVALVPGDYPEMAPALMEKIQQILDHYYTS